MKVQDVFIKFKDVYMHKYRPTYSQRKILNKIVNCRTEKLGFRVYQCDCCEEEIYVNNSCKDRHCPNCQNYQREKWILLNVDNILETEYIHIVFTIPRMLNPIFYYNQKKAYNILFKASSTAVLNAYQELYGLRVGITSMLHTWSQRGNYFPHVHMVVTRGGIKDDRWCEAGDIDVNFLKDKFKKILLRYLAKNKFYFYSKYNNLNNPNTYQDLIEKARKTSFNCYCKKPFDKVEDIYEYLGQFAFKVWIGDEKIEDVTSTHVYYKYKDYKNREISKIGRIRGEEFIRKYLMHILPKSFIKIRYYGVYSTKNKREKMEFLMKITNTKKIEKKITKIELLKKINKKDVTKCKCGGTYIYIKDIKYNELKEKT